MLEILSDNGLHNYHPELGEKKPSGCVFEARLGFYGKHWYLKSLNGQTLKGRGVVDEGDGKYRVTMAAFEKICKEYPVKQELFLD